VRNPETLSEVSRSRPLALRQALLGATDRAQDLGISTTTADVLVHPTDDLLVRGMGCFLKRAHAAEDHARGAVPTLHGPFGQEGLLDGVEAIPLGQAFNGGDAFVRDLGDSGLARGGPFAVDQDRTGATLALAASVFGSGGWRSSRSTSMRGLSGSVKTVLSSPLTTKRIDTSMIRTCLCPRCQVSMQTH